jgi:hypothetical protein
MKKIIVFITILVFSDDCMSQYDNFFHNSFNQGYIFQPVMGDFTPVKLRGTKNNQQGQKPYSSYRFSNTAFNFQYCYPEAKSDNDCSYFVVGGKRINIFGVFENNFACDLDISSFKLYKGSFKNRKYLLLTCINTGSGSSTTSVICNLFDITDINSIKYYPLWAKFGSSTFFGDFDKDGKLDFIQSRYYNGKKDLIFLKILSLSDGQFLDKSEGHFIIIKVSGQKSEVVKKHWY